jgi:hypothetical protein
MGKFLEKFKRSGEKVEEVGRKIGEKANNQSQQPRNSQRNIGKRLKEKRPESISEDMYGGVGEDLEDDFDDMDDYGLGNQQDDYGVGIQPAQKPESFHHFILENQYKDLEKSIRGYKDVYHKERREWETKRKETHCFTDEEAEEILRMAQSLLATDIKLSFINKEVFGIKAMMLYKRLKQLFRETAEYRYGRYSHNTDGTPKEGGYAIEQAMKLQNLKIFVELTERIVANYSRAIAGVENRLTHQSVSAQESLQSSDRLEDQRRGYS